MKKIFSTFKNIQKRAIHDVAGKPHLSTIRIPLPNSSKTLDFLPIWLRHHCQCERCYSPTTFQKLLIPSNLPELSHPQDVSISAKDNSLRILWKDGHSSLFKLPELERIHDKISKVRVPPTKADVPLSFHRDPFPPLTIPPPIPYDQYISSSSTSGVAQLLSNIVQHGVATISSVPPDYETTQGVVLRLSHPLTTLFGSFSKWSSDLEHADSAYTSDHVHLHTDTSYFTEPAGLQIFHCLHHDGEGGINHLVDGFQISSRLLEEDYPPALHDALSSLPLPSQYIAPGQHHYYSEAPTFQAAREPGGVRAGALERIRYNPHDLGTIHTVPSPLLPTLYEALVTLSREIEGAPTPIKLRPGLVIFLDNWRVLHGRTGFTGKRTLCGAYISRSDWMSRARLLGVL